MVIETPKLNKETNTSFSAFITFILLRNQFASSENGALCLDWGGDYTIEYTTKN